MKKKGFTLVELLAVIAILAILVIIALPNIMSLFNQAKQNSFENELKNIYKSAQQEWMKDSMFDTQNIIYSRCSENCSNELDLSGRKEIDYYIEVDKAGKVIKYFATDGSYQYEYKGKGLKIEQIGASKQIAKLESNKILKISCNKIEKDGKDVTNVQESVPVSLKIYWALQDNDEDSINETLIISNSSVAGNESGSFNGNTNFGSSSVIPWVKSSERWNDSNLSYNVTTVKIEGEVAPTSTSNWFIGVGYNSSTFNADLSNLNVSNVTNMYHMFYETGYKATAWSIGDLSNFNTSNVANINGMFEGAGYNAVDWTIGKVSSWDTSKIKYMSGVFVLAGYRSKTFNLDISNWNTSNVINMSQMFWRAGENAATYKIMIPSTNGNGIDNTTSRMFGADSSVYIDASNSKSGRVFTLAS